MRPLTELTGTTDPAWPIVLGWLAAADISTTVLPRNESASETCLYRLQVTTRSVLGALAWESGGLLVDHGWLRLLGGGPVLPDLASASGLGDPTEQSAPPPFLTVGYDVVGGRFAVNGGGLPANPGEVCYFGPDTLDWLPLGMGHGAFVEWTLTVGGLGDFYADLRWPGWQQETQQVGPEQGLSVWPPLFTEQARADLAATSRRPVPITELLGFHDYLAEQLRQVPDGGAFTLDVDPFTA